MSSFGPLARLWRGIDALAEFPNLAALLAQEGDKVSDGYHYARWIVPVVGAVLGLAVFLPLALLQHPLFWIGGAGLPVVSGILGAIFHVLAGRISPTRMQLRKRCVKLQERRYSMRGLVGQEPALSRFVLATLDHAASIYLRVSANPSDSELAVRIRGEIERAMAELMRLALLDSVAAQEGELERGWAEPLVEEMRAVARTLETADTSLVNDHSHTLRLQALREEMSQLQSATEELDRDLRA